MGFRLIIHAHQPLGSNISTYTKITMARRRTSNDRTITRIIVEVAAMWKPVPALTKGASLESPKKGLEMTDVNVYTNA